MKLPKGTECRCVLRSHDPGCPYRDDASEWLEHAAPKRKPYSKPVLTAYGDLRGVKLGPR